LILRQPALAAPACRRLRRPIGSHLRWKRGASARRIPRPIHRWL